jgi:spore coat polysaccharide biosynthesis protein SpsF (cytidylyltransferase family)
MIGSLVIGAIVQARMTSSRLPGKVLMEIQGRPVIDYLYERLSFCPRLEIIVLATTTNREDDPLIDYIKKKRLPFFRGSEHDVLDRYYRAALKFGITHIMRITADCPLIDPEICDHLIETYLNKQMDYVVTGSTYAEGLDCEVFSFKALEMVWREARLKSEREHVTQFFHNHPEVFKMGILPNKTDDSKYRFTIDEEVDFVLVKTILVEFCRQGKSYFTTEEIKNFLDAHPDIYQLNAHIIRNEGIKKSLKEDHVV